MKVAIVHEWLTNYGGSERVMECMHELYPEAPIYTLVYDKDKMPEKFRNMNIKTTFLQNIPFAIKNYQFFLPLMPRAFEELDLMEYDLVLSSSTACAKGILTRPDTVHICYCHTPMRYAWEFYHEYKNNYDWFRRSIISFFIHRIRLWDRLASDRVDHFISNSNFIASRIKKYYRRDATTIYPPVNTHLYKINEKPGEYYLIVSRLIPYKRIDIAIDAFNKLGYTLIIIGDGSNKKELMNKAQSNILFKGRMTDEEISQYYSNAKAFIFPGEEDFGITPVEAQASGVPVLAFGRGGALESVLDGKTGIFFQEQNTNSLINAIAQLNKNGVKYTKTEIKEHAEQFSVVRFKKEFSKYINKVLNTD